MTIDMDITTAQKLVKYITEQANEANFYRELANIAPTEEEKKLLLDLSNDKKQQEMIFQAIYRDGIGRTYEPVLEPVNLNRPFRSLIQDQILQEIKLYRNYDDEYIKENTNLRLKDAYQRARTESNALALSLLYLLRR